MRFTTTITEFLWTRSSLTVGIVAVVFSLAITCRAEPPNREAVARWVAALASDSRAERVRAEAALVEAGTPVIDLLPSESSLDPAVRESLERIVRTIEEVETKSAMVPRTVRLPSRDLNECLAAIETHTGNPLTRPHRPWPQLSASPPTEPLTFWQAIEWLELHSQVRYGGHQLRVAEQPQPMQTSSRGPFRILLRDHSTRSTASGQTLLGVKLRFECEPRLRPLFLVAAVDSWKAALGGMELAAFTPGASREFAASRNGETDVAYDFLVPAGAEGKLSLTGEVALTLSARSTSVTFSDLQARFPLIRRRGQVSVSLLSLKADDQKSTFRLALAFPETRGLFESYRSSLLNPELSLELADGSQVSATDIAQVQEDPDGNILEARFANQSQSPTRLRAQVPTAITTQSVRFEFAEISLAAPTAP